ncbi:MAG: SGNH/GDSL hydrolase family protein [Tannerellaceae bacterium]|nr:SGNH/GDSL hydrolase family protein [Tannerellaceae bacterium]
MRTFFLFLAGVGLSGILSAQSLEPFREGDKVAFVGNSITDGGHYHSYIWLYYMTRLPREQIRIYNVGIGGDRAYDINKRFEQDVLVKRPNVIYLTFGMNDSGYMEYNQPEAGEFARTKIEESYQDYLSIEKKLQNLQDTRISLIGSSPYDETARIENTPLKNKNAAMQQIIRFQQTSAEKNGWNFFDLNHPMTAINQKYQQTSPSFTICGNDRIHPDNDGHMVMAYLLLQAQGFSGKKVADIRMDAKTQKFRTENCTLSGLSVSPEEITFDYLAHSLPYPLDTIPRGWGSQKSQAEATRIIPFIEEMNQETLQIQTLLKGNYRLTIDDIYIDTFSDQELAAGINLALYTQSPQYQQALAIMHLNEERWEIERRFRQYAWIQFGFFQEKGLLFANDRQAIEVMDRHIPENGWVAAHRDIYSKAIHKEVREVWEKEMQLIIDTIYRINKPQLRKIRLKQEIKTEK